MAVRIQYSIWESLLFYTLWLLNYEADFGSPTMVSSTTSSTPSLAPVSPRPATSQTRTTSMALKTGRSPTRWSGRWSFEEREEFRLPGEGSKVMLKRPKGSQCRGDHGYDNALFSMRTIFLADGPRFGKVWQVLSFENVEISTMWYLQGSKRR